MAKKHRQKKLTISPLIGLLILIIGVSVLSFILSLLNVDASQTSIVNGKLETSIVVIKSIFSKEGLINFFTSIMNYELLKPIILIILSLASASVFKTSGLLNHLFTPFKKLKSSVLTFIVLFLSIISSFIGDYSYIILIPFVSIIYSHVNKKPILGIITTFIGITLGYGIGLFGGYNDYILGSFTELSAVINVDATYKYSIYSDLYIMIFSTIGLTILLTQLIEKNLSKKVSIKEVEEEEFLTSKKALTSSMITFIILLIPFGLMILPNGVLLDTTQPNYLTQLFGTNSGFNISFMYLFLITISICSFVYGKISGNFKNNEDFSKGLTKEFNDIGYLMILLLLSSILINIIDWTNIGVVFANKLLELLSLLDLNGIALIIISFIIIVLISVFIPGSLEKWVLISPVLVPVFMRGNLTPDFAQFVFKIADSIGKIFTPVFIYLVMAIGFIQKYNDVGKKVTLFTILKLVYKIVLIVTIIWILLLVIWYIAGLPLGIGTYATM